MDLDWRFIVLILHCLEHNKLDGLGLYDITCRPSTPCFQIMIYLGRKYEVLSNFPFW